LPLQQTPRKRRQRPAPPAHPLRRFAHTSWYFESLARNPGEIPGKKKEARGKKCRNQGAAPADRRGFVGNRGTVAQFQKFLSDFLSILCHTFIFQCYS
jgi:hypothetical protein